MTSGKTMVHRIQIQKMGNGKNNGTGCIDGWMYRQMTGWTDKQIDDTNLAANKSLMDKKQHNQKDQGELKWQSNIYCNDQAKARMEPTAK